MDYLDKCEKDNMTYAVFEKLEFLLNFKRLMKQHYQTPGLEIDTDEINTNLKAWKLFEFVIDPTKCVSDYTISVIGSNQSYEQVKVLEVIFLSIEIIPTKINEVHNEELCHEDEYRHHHTPNAPFIGYEYEAYYTEATTQKVFNASKKNNRRKSSVNKTTKKEKK